MPRRRTQRRKGDVNVRVRQRELGPLIANMWGPQRTRTLMYVTDAMGNEQGTLTLAYTDI